MITGIKRLSRVAALALTITALTSPALAGSLDSGLKYVPADFSLVVGVDFDSIRASKIYRAIEPELLRSLGVTMELEQLAKETGFDVMKDVKSLIIAGPEAMMRGGDAFVMVIGAKHDAPRLVAYLNKVGAKLEPKTSSAGKYFAIDGEGAIGFFGDHIVIGPTKHFNQALKAKAGRNVTQGRLGATLRKFKGSKSGFAVVAGSKALRDSVGPNAKELEDLTAIGMGFDVSRGVGVSMLASFNTTKAPASLATQFNNGIREASSDPEIKEMGLDGLVNKIQASARGKDFNLSLSLTDKETETLVEFFEAMVGGGGNDWK